MIGEERVDKAAQLADPLGWRIRNAVVRRLPERAQRRQLESLGSLRALTLRALIDALLTPGPATASD